MSSMGDIFHTFPAITDLKEQHPEVEIDWVVEQGFAEIAAWHPAINRVIPIALRQWLKRKDRNSWQEFRAWRRELRANHYDYVIDAQGLLKSALVAKNASADSIHGYDKKSAREAVCNWFYSNKYFIEKNQHAVERTRQLFGGIFNYTPAPAINFGINQNFVHVKKHPRKLVFIIGTSWTTKLWDTTHWQQLAQIAVNADYDVEIIWGSKQEKNIARAIIEACPRASRPSERMSITAIAEKLVGATGVVGLDTGFSHLAGALEIPTIALYGPTSPTKVGLIGDHTCNLQLPVKLECMPCHKRQCKWLPENSTDTPPCLKGIEAEQVWDVFLQKIHHHADQP